MNRVSRVVGHAAWWVFIVALLARGLTWANYFGVYDNGWTAYTPLTDRPARSSGLWDAVLFDPVFDDTLTSTALGALAVVVVAAAVEVVWVRSWWLRIVNVLVPVLAGWFTLWLVADRPLDSLRLTVALLLLAVAVRELWSRYYVVKLNARGTDHGADAPN